MSGDVTRYIVTIKFKEETLTELNELNNHLTRAGFTLTLSDDEGKVHEPGTNSFGLITLQSVEEIKELVVGLANTAIGKPVEVEVITFEQWLKDQ
ncbi:type V toxin-antitoxin system endoribonuclease antitoxin GhoS [Pseudocitrobacter cyperus]|uniref:Type V toxin-antitoxin system endoribonuclease antitoxin GhoS n=1 Tax=Pseudocitrobacter cyperus TaxID=3112843 RepID=A0ABV0HD58_9ENTR